MLSTLDWALIETWREAGIPLEAVLRGIDAAFDKHDAQRARLGSRRQRKVNGLAWCAQAVLEAVEQSREAAIGAGHGRTHSEPARRDVRLRSRPHRPLPHPQRRRCSTPPPQSSPHPRTPPPQKPPPASAPSPRPGRTSNLEPRPRTSNLEPWNLEETDRTLTVLEEKLFAALLTATPEAELTQLRAQADRELAPYRGKMQAVQIKQVQQQFLQKRLLEAHALPRLSLFYMPHEDEPELCRSTLEPEIELQRTSNLRHAAPPVRTSAPAADASSSTSPTPRSSTLKADQLRTLLDATGLTLPELQTPPLAAARLPQPHPPHPRRIAGQLRAGYIRNHKVRRTRTSNLRNLGFPPHHPVPHRRAHPLARRRSPARAAQPAPRPWLRTRALHPRPARTLHHRRRVAAGQHQPLRPHLRKDPPRQIHRRLRRPLRIPPRPTSPRSPAPASTCSRRAPPAAAASNSRAPAPPGARPASTTPSPLRTCQPDRANRTTLRPSPLPASPNN
jgi:hypothetical protein